MLPARFPNLLVNGSQGIAVGMATNIPPHNLGEIIDAIVWLLDNPDATPDDLMRVRERARTSPPAAQILGRVGILEAYRTGRGSIRMRADAEIEELPSGRHRSWSPRCPTRPRRRRSRGASASWSTAATSRASADINDESSRDDTRLVIELKRDANANWSC